MHYNWLLWSSCRRGEQVHIIIIIMRCPYNIACVLGCRLARDPDDPRSKVADEMQCRARSSLSGPSRGSSHRCNVIHAYVYIYDINVIRYTVCMGHDCAVISVPT